MLTHTQRHKDSLGRYKIIKEKHENQEHFLRPEDGRLAPLTVQGIENTVGYGNVLTGGRTWAFKGESGRHITIIMRLLCWVHSFRYKDGSMEKRDMSEDGSAMMLFLVWLPCCLILTLLLFIPQSLEGQFRNQGLYDPILYRDWRYPKVSRNRYEGKNEDECEGEERGQHGPRDLEARAISRPIATTRSNSSGTKNDNDGILARHFGPRFLCFVTGIHEQNGVEFKTCRVSDWIRDNGEHAYNGFVFLSYTRHQFCVDSEGEIYDPKRWTDLSGEQRENLVPIAKRDRQALLKKGVEAARSANRVAFWIDFECIRDIDTQPEGTAENSANSKSDDVYRICDIVRAAYSMVIFVGPSLGSKIQGTPETYSQAITIEWLQAYGDRLWTLPEILLCPSERRIKLHFYGKAGPPEELAKRDFPARAVWKDADRVRELVDHYESTIDLSPLELVSIALECLAERNTQKFREGDIAYALMGLLRRRPMTNDKDSSFEAFARLSVANVSDALLERLICMQPLHRDAPWYEIKDDFGARLWDIEPRCQVAGIVDDQAVTLDGAVGASIRWDRMDQVAFFKRPTTARTFAKVALRTMPGYLLAGIGMVGFVGSLLSYDGIGAELGALGAGMQGLLAVGIIFLVPGVIVFLLAPYMIFELYRGEFWSTQAMFIGIEGVPDDLGWVERHLFGLNQGRLKWSVAGSTLSQHKLSTYDECEALPPKESTPALKFANEAKGSNYTNVEEKPFTLIDIYTRTATVYYAVRPPTALIVCGQEGGMQRAVLYSYDWRRGTFSREAVVRVKTIVLERMFRVDRFRFALNRKMWEKHPESPGSTSETRLE
ncbi:uncharacterized protein F4812DRAFT_98305 [Daldinia caldariorum]|uniref:uncharacterized protein n=1 Tax=Daldinia caldariorum TaxID=326644 RepID=UPI0020078730|nr:uncharacterized protein F4812DRAFT_98305 [Daldinia caldariorum]KAI1466142.1 hypothetical protein F4812DRAFT_98305 [Daldinia caldariorum]